jgi:DNA repair photolyase
MGLPVIAPKKPSSPPVPYGVWKHAAVIMPNNFVYKSLSNWAVNIAVGCGHACRFCYVPSTSTNKLAPQLKALGVDDPDADWGDYVFLREWDEEAFLSSLRAADKKPEAKLAPDGNRAVIYCSTTDPYQVFRHPNPVEQKKLAEAARHLVRRSLELIRDHSSLNVRILTRSPLARLDFDLFKSFGPRLLFGMSLPTLRNDLAKVYEPKAPAPSVRLATLQAAKKEGIPVFIAMAPTYPECDEADLRATLTAVAPLNPYTVFHEPINIRAENVERIAAQARELGISLRTEVFQNRETWKDYALESLVTVQRVAKEVGLEKRLHLWPDKNLGSDWVVNSLEEKRREKYRAWLQSWWTRVSEWPTPQAMKKREKANGSYPLANIHEKTTVPSIAHFRMNALGNKNLRVV